MDEIFNIHDDERTDIFIVAVQCGVAADDPEEDRTPR
jgi:hypothetical protein